MEKKEALVGGVKLLHQDKKKKVLIGLFFPVFKNSTDAWIKTAHSNGGTHQASSEHDFIPQLR